MSCANAASAQDTAEIKLDTSPEITYNTYMSKYLNVSNAMIESILESL